MMKIMKLGFILCWMLLFSSPAPLMAQLFQWTDARGTIHLTDNLHSVPESLRGARSLIIRNDFNIKGGALELPRAPETDRQEPVTEPKSPDVAGPPEAAQKTAAPNIHYNPQPITIVVVNSTVNHTRKHRCPVPEGCQGLLRPNFDDRRYIHPSVFDGGSRQFIQPK